MMKILQLAMLMSVLACHTIPVTPRVGIDIRKMGKEYIFSFRNCYDPTKLIGIYAIKVTKLRKGGDREGDLYCRIFETGPGEELTRQWTYGTTPPGYESNHCEPLDPSETYTVSASGGGFGNALFTTDKDGGVQLVEGNCK